MTTHINTGGLWKEAVPFVNASGWKQADAYVRQGGLWYQTTQSGLNLMIDSATPLYDFNLKTWLQSAGLWPASGPVVINELQVSARTVITHTKLTTRTPPNFGGKSGAPPVKPGYILEKTYAAGQTVGTTLVGGNISYIKYLHDYYTYIEDLTAHAFTTGEGWPAGSKIKNFIVAGTIIGRGGDGAGLHGPTGSYDATSWSRDYPNQITNNYVPQAGVLLRHGWPGLKVTIPVEVLSVPGTVAGGGAGGCYSSPIYLTYTQGDAAQKAQAEQAIAAINALQKPLHKDVGTLGGRVVVPGYAGMLFYPMILGGHASMVANGCGGGQGGGFGGQRAVYSNTSAYSFVLGTDGGDGTLNAVGGAGTGTVSYYTTDTKYGGTPTKLVGGGIPGATAGQDSPSSPVPYLTLWDGTVIAYFDRAPGTSYNVDVYGLISVYIASKPIYAQGGDAITGRSLITTTSGNIRGKQV